MGKSSQQSSTKPNFLGNSSQQSSRRPGLLGNSPQQNDDRQREQEEQREEAKQEEERNREQDSDSDSGECQDVMCKNDIYSRRDFANWVRKFHPDKNSNVDPEVFKTIFQEIQGCNSERDFCKK